MQTVSHITSSTPGMLTPPPAPPSRSPNQTADGPGASKVATDLCRVGNPGATLSFARTDTSLSEAQRAAFLHRADAVGVTIRKGASPTKVVTPSGARQLWISWGAHVARVVPDKSNNVWRLFSAADPAKPGPAVRYVEGEKKWCVHNNVGLPGGGMACTKFKKEKTRETGYESLLDPSQKSDDGIEISPPYNFVRMDEVARYCPPPQGAAMSHPSIANNAHCTSAGGSAQTAPVGQNPPVGSPDASAPGDVPGVSADDARPPVPPKRGTTKPIAPPRPRNSPAKNFWAADPAPINSVGGSPQKQGTAGASAYTLSVTHNLPAGQLRTQNTAGAWARTGPSAQNPHAGQRGSTAGTGNSNSLIKIVMPSSHDDPIQTWVNGMCVTPTIEPPGHAVKSEGPSPTPP